MLMRHLNFPLPMDTNPSDEPNFLSGAAKMPVPYHLDESDSDSIVSRKFSSDFYFLRVCVYQSECLRRSSVRLILDLNLSCFQDHLEIVTFVKFATWAQFYLCYRFLQGKIQIIETVPLISACVTWKIMIYKRRTESIDV